MEAEIISTPQVDGPVLWIGTVEPTAALDGDLWTDTDEAVDLDLDGAVADLVNSSGGTGDGTIASIPLPADSPLTADALRDDLSTNVIPAIRNGLSDLAVKLNAILAVLRARGTGTGRLKIKTGGAFVTLGL